MMWNESNLSIYFSIHVPAFPLISDYIGLPSPVFKQLLHLDNVCKCGCLNENDTYRLSQSGTIRKCGLCGESVSNGHGL